MLRLAEHDDSTEGHSRRVALLAVRAGEALNLPPATLRHLAVGGLLHDIGKLSVRGAVLRKPGALDHARPLAGWPLPAASSTPYPGLCSGTRSC
jgi:HD-GYP domain-containing protein (c-di-GMP phosphodiesterase class II)